ncbi:MAG: GntR family transcriptional regulator [Candidatus Roseilinea sp.]|nr:MAG: GntR family transcriptional regulator [Candidatus Roseilinea sp.]
MVIDRNSPVPLYYQLKQQMLEKIEKGEWKPGDSVPTEQELQQSYNLSRTTVRQALAEMVMEGRLTRQRGRGTYVAQPKFQHDPLRHRTIERYLMEQGLTPGLKVLDECRIVAPAEVAARLRLPHGGRVYCLHRLRLADDEPIGYLVSYVPEALAEGIDRDALDKGGSTDYLKRLPQMNGHCVERSIEAVAAGQPEAKLLRVKRGAPMLAIERLIVARDGAPIEFLKALYRGDRMKYQITCS